MCVFAPARSARPPPRALDEACCNGFRASTGAILVSKTHGDALRRPYMMCQAPGTSVYAPSRPDAQNLGYLQWINWMGWRPSRQARASFSRRRCIF